MNCLKTGLCGLAASAALVFVPLASADPSIEVDMHLATNDGQGDPAGTITLEQNRHGVLIITSLKNISPGVHGFHLHENPSCDPKTEDGETTPAGAAGGHYDPADTGAHRGPYDPDGHLGDLPRIFIVENQDEEQTYLAPRLELDDFIDRALMIHEGGDNYSDDPEPLGGGGARVACGVVTVD